MNLSFTTNFVVFPKDTNYMPPMVFGGKMLSEMDIAAATAVRRLLYDSPTGAKDAVTVAVDKVVFHKGAEVKDLIILNADIIELGVKSVTIQVHGYREVASGSEHKMEHMCEGLFRFVAYDLKKKVAIPHGLSFKDKEHD